MRGRVESAVRTSHTDPRRLYCRPPTADRRPPTADALSLRADDVSSLSPRAHRSPPPPPPLLLLPVSRSAPASAAACEVLLWQWGKERREDRGAGRVRGIFFVGIPLFFRDARERETKRAPSHHVREKKKTARCGRGGKGGAARFWKEGAPQENDRVQALSRSRPQTPEDDDRRKRNKAPPATIQ
jgi:hypothetical protein